MGSLVRLAAVAGALCAACQSAPESDGSGDDRREVFAIDPLPSPTDPGSGQPNLVRGADGEVYLSWIERAPDESARMSFARLDGEAWGTPRPIATGDDWFVNWADLPGLAAGSDGTLLAHWLQYLGEGTYAYGVRIRLSTDAGSTWSEARWLHEDRSPVEHGFVSAVPTQVNGRDEFLTTWLDARALAAGANEDASTALFVRTVGADGALGPEACVDSRVCDCCPTSLAAVGGEFALAYRDRSAAEVRDIAWARGEGPALVFEALVNDDGWEIDGCPVNGPRLASDDDRLAAVWFTGADEAQARVYAAFFDGERFGDPITLDDGNPEGRVDAIFLDGTLVAAWLENAGERWEWRIRTVHPGGGTSRASRIAAVAPGRRSGLLRLAAESPDTCLAAWTVPGVSGTGDTTWKESTVLTARLQLLDPTTR